MIGSGVVGNYQILRRLNIGGMGEIFLARQRSLGGISRLAIVKALRPELSAQPDMVEQFFDEARIIASLNHPNIVVIYDIAEDQGTPWIAMEFVDGVDVSLLVTLSEQQGALISPRLAATIVRDAALGLDHAHNAEVDGRALSVVHRDVSPQNIMVRRDGVVKVVDFGLALATNRVHQTQSANTIKGKVRYMSPEQANAEPLDARTDQFALGVVLWELLAGRGMFETDNPLIVLRELTQERARTPLAHNPAAPPALAAIAMRMLERDRTRRYPSLADAAEALRVVLDSMAGDHRAELAAFVEGIAGRHLRERQHDHGKPPSDPHPLAREGQALAKQDGNAKRDVVVVGVCFGAFAMDSVSERQAAERHALDLVQRCAERERGDVVRAHAVDGCSIAFGAVVAHVDDAVRAWRCAGALATEFAASGTTPALGLALSSGPATIVREPRLRATGAAIDEASRAARWAVQTSTTAPQATPAFVARAAAAASFSPLTKALLAGGGSIEVHGLLPGAQPPLTAVERARALRQQALVALRAARVHDAERDVRAAMAVIDEDERELAASLMSVQAQALEARGALTEAIQLLMAAFEKMHGIESEDRDFYWENLNHLGRFHVRAGHLDRALELLTQAREQAQRAGSASGFVKSTTNLAAVLVSQGSPEQALRMLDEVLAFLDPAVDPVGAARVHYNRARLLAGFSRAEEARRALEMALRPAREAGWSEGVALITQASDELKGAHSGKTTRIATNTVDPQALRRRIEVPDEPDTSVSDKTSRKS